MCRRPGRRCAVTGDHAAGQQLVQREVVREARTQGGDDAALVDATARADGARDRAQLVERDRHRRLTAGAPAASAPTARAATSMSESPTISAPSATSEGRRLRRHRQCELAIFSVDEDARRLGVEGTVERHVLLELFACAQAPEHAQALDQVVHIDLVVREDVIRRQRLHPALDREHRLLAAMLGEAVVDREVWHALIRDAVHNAVHNAGHLHT